MIGGQVIACKCCLATNAWCVIMCVERLVFHDQLYLGFEYILEPLHIRILCKELDIQFDIHISRVYRLATFFIFIIKKRGLI